MINTVEVPDFWVSLVVEGIVVNRQIRNDSLGCCGGSDKLYEFAVSP